MVKTSMYKNGVTVVTEHMASVRSVSLGIWVSNGSKHEEKNENGVSHFIEHMLFKGTENRTAKDIANEMDYMGGQINAFTSKEYTCYHTRTLDTHFTKALDILADMFFNSVFDDKEINKERGVIQEEIDMYEDSPEDLAHELITLNVFRGNPLSYPVLGDKHTVGGFNKKSLKSFFGRRYTPKNTIISIAGNFNQDTILDEIGRYFGDYKDVVSVNVAPHLDAELETPVFTPSVIKKPKDIEQVHLCMAFPCIRHGTDETYTLSVFDTIFGGGMSSRLFQKIREDRGLVYSIYSSPSTFQNAGLYSIYAGMNANCTSEVMSLILDEIAGLGKNKIDEDTLKKTKEQIKSGYIIGLESTQNRMISIGRSMLLLGHVPGTDEVIKKIDNVTISGIYQLTDKIFDMEKMSAAAVGNVEKIKLVV